MRHVEAPSRNVSPARASNTISSSSSPTRALSFSAPDRNTPNKPAIGNGAGIGDGHALGALPRHHHAVDAIPRHARPQLREFVRWIAARQHVEHAVEDRPAQLGERRRRSHGAVEIVDRPSLHRRHRHELLREHVERIARIAGRFHLALPHRRGDRGARHQVAAKLRKDDAFADLTDAVAGAADALQAARHRRRRLDLDHQVDRAHVDAELERRGRDQRAQVAALQQIFDLGALRARQRAMMRAHQRLAGNLVERAGQPFREAPAVHEQQRRAMRSNQLDQLRMNRAPDRLRHRPLRRRPARLLDGFPHRRHVFDRRLHGDRQLLRRARIDDRHRPVLDRVIVFEFLVTPILRSQSSGMSLERLWRSCVFVRVASRGRLVSTAEIPRHLVQRPLRRRQPDPLQRLVRQSVRAVRATAPGARRAWSPPSRESRR